MWFSIWLPAPAGVEKSLWCSCVRKQDFIWKQLSDVHDSFCVKAAVAQTSQTTCHTVWWGRQELRKKKSEATALFPSNKQSHTVYADCLGGFCALIYTRHTSYLHYLHTSIYRPSYFCLRMATYFLSTTQRNYCPHINQKRKKKSDRKTDCFSAREILQAAKGRNLLLVLVLIMCVSRKHWDNHCVEPFN